jgi:hypothetical protein
MENDGGDGEAPTNPPWTRTEIFFKHVVLQDMKAKAKYAL